MPWATYAFPGAGVYITMELLRTQLIERTPVNSDDDTTYLYTKWLLSFTAHLNPYATNAYQTGDGVVHQTRPGQIGLRARRALTDRTIRHWMMQQRGVFQLLDDDGTILVQCPDVTKDVNSAGNLTCDAAGGPHPRAFSIQRVDGTEGYLVAWKIELNIRECPTDETQPNIILSHRFTQKELIGDKCLSTRVVESDVDLHVGNMFRFGLVPDMLRPLLIHRCPPGWRREHLDITHSSDWKKMHIVSVDHQLTHSWKAGLIDVKAHSSRGSNWSGWDLAEALGAAGRTLNAGLQGALMGAVAGQQQLAGSNVPGAAWAGAGVGFGMGAKRQGLHEAFNIGMRALMPTHTHTVTVLAVGGPEAKRWNVEMAALDIALAIMRKYDPEFLTDKFLRPTFDVHIDSDMAGKTVQVTMSALYGPGVRGIIFNFGAMKLLTPGQQEPANYEELLDKSGLPLVTTAKLPIAGPVYGNGTRTTYLGAMVANLLQQPCEPPGSPENWLYLASLIPQTQMQATPPSTMSAVKAQQYDANHNPIP